MSSNVIETAAQRRREVLAAVSSATGTEDAATAVSQLLAVGTDEAREVLGRGVVDDEHIAAELGERIDDRETDGVEAQDEHSEAHPVGVPAREAVEARRRVAAHISESHSM